MSHSFRWTGRLLSGAVGFKAEKPRELREAIEKVFKVEGPAIVDCVVSADELSNLPHIDLERAKNFAIAKVREKILAVTGG